MKAYVDRDTCIGCELCAATCPEVFEMDDEAKSVPIENDLTNEQADGANEAAAACPVDAITVE